MSAAGPAISGRLGMVEPWGIEPQTFAMPLRCLPYLWPRNGGAGKPKTRNFGATTGNLRSQCDPKRAVHPVRR